MKVLIVSKALITAAYRCKLTELAALGLEVTAVVPPEWREGGAVQRLEESEEGAYDLVVTRMRWNGHFHVHYYPKLPDIIQQIRPDIVHMDEEPYNLATYQGVRAASRQGAASIFFSWQNLPRRYPPPFSLLERRVYAMSRAGLAGSEEVAAVLRAKGYTKPLAVIPQFGIDPALFSPRGGSRPGGFRVGYPNRLIPGKAPLLMLDAFERLPGDATLHIVGDGPLRSQLEQEVARRALTDRIDIQPRISSLDMPGFLREMDVVVLPSVTTPRWKEQFGRVLIEAMACGVPVVASDSGEIPQVVGDAGIIVPEGNAPALAEGIQRLRDADLRSSLAGRGRERVLAHFSHAAIARATAQVYREVVSV